MMEDIDDLFDIPDGADDHDHHPHHTWFSDLLPDGDDFAPPDKEKRSRTKRSYVVSIVLAIVFVIFLFFMIRAYA